MTGVLLVGGASRRFGSPKALAELDGEAFAVRIHRTLVEAFPHTAPAEAAFVKLAKYYDDIRRYDLEAEALSQLGSYFPKTRYDAWWEAGELYERRLKDPVKAKDAYSKVPQTSRRYRDAQKKLTEL